MGKCGAKTFRYRSGITINGKVQSFCLANFKCGFQAHFGKTIETRCLFEDGCNQQTKNRTEAREERAKPK